MIKPPSIAPKIERPKPNGHWEFPELMGAGVGFLYCIVDLVLGRGYIGKKHNAAKKGDWKSYLSSSVLVNQLLDVRPKEEFRFICLEEYKYVGSLSWAETWSLCQVRIPESNSWYNTLIPTVSWNSKERITDRHMERLDLCLKLLKEISLA